MKICLVGGKRIPLAAIAAREDGAIARAAASSSQIESLRIHGIARRWEIDGAERIIPSGLRYIHRRWREGGAVRRAPKLVRRRHRLRGSVKIRSADRHVKWRGS